MSTAAADAIIHRIAPPAGPTSFFQVGYVVPDLQNALDFFTERLGTQGFLVMKDAQLDDQMYYGKPFAPRQDLAFSYAGHLQFELIHPIDGGDESCYTTFLDAHPAGGLHHTAVLVESFAAGLEQIGAEPSEVIQSGRFGEGTRFGYVDAAPTGALLEIIELDEGGAGMFEQLRLGQLA